MTIASSTSANRNLDLLCKIPNNLKVKLDKVSQKAYAELYEPVTDKTASLQDDLEEILELFQDGNRTLAHLRYVWMALILAIVVSPTIKHYQPNNSIPDETTERMTSWLLEAIASGISSKMSSVKASDLNSPDPGFVISRSFSKKLEGFQALYEALDVYANAIKTLDEDQSLEALINILDECLEGYAIFPGSYGRRDLFNWWLLDVVPASWCLLPPNSVYVVESLPNSAELRLHQIKALEQISSKIQSILQHSSVEIRKNEERT
jgi:hypothetical protein